MLKRGCLMVCGWLLMQPVLAQDQELDEVKKLVTDTVQAVLNVLRAPGAGPATRREKVMATIMPVFDFDTMSALTLGRENWGKFSATQKTEFRDLFVKQLQNSYLDKAEMHADGQVQFETPVRVRTWIHMMTYAAGKGERLGVLYKLRRESGKWMIYDVEVEGVSIVRSYRSQYTDVLRTRTVDDLLKDMRDAVARQEQ
jgi:phospholipid transport system substrate-binding protein